MTNLEDKKENIAGKMRKISSYMGDVGESVGWKNRRANFKASENKSFGKSLIRNIKKTRKGKESLEFPKHKDDFEGQKSYKQEDK